VEGLSKDFWQLGAIGVIPAGQSVLHGGGAIPYLPKRSRSATKTGPTGPRPTPKRSAICWACRASRTRIFRSRFSRRDGDLLMVYPFAATNRIIYMKDHSDLPVDSWMGKSSGTWEGDVLVVTTTSQNGQSWLDRAGNFATNQLKVTERFKLLDVNHIWYEATLEDPQTFSKAWTIEMPLYRLIDNNAQLLEHKCVPFTDMLLYHDLLQPKQ
jgi:hypothetical protein